MELQKLEPPHCRVLLCPSADCQALREQADKVLEKWARQVLNSCRGSKLRLIDLHALVLSEHAKLQRG